MDSLDIALRETSILKFLLQCTFYKSEDPDLFGQNKILTLWKFDFNLICYKVGFMDKN